MSKRPKASRLSDYLLRWGIREARALRLCRENASKSAMRAVPISPEHASLVQLMARAIRARRAVMVGVRSGYVSIAVALALREMHGMSAVLIACEISANRLDLAADYWMAAGVSGVIQAHLGGPSDSLHALLAAGEAGTFDLAVVDTEEGDFDLYYELCLRLIRPGGVLAMDHMLAGGAVAEPADHSAQARALRTLAAKVYADERVDMSLTGLSDGLSLILKR